jgi:hypothetical protein
MKKIISAFILTAILATGAMAGEKPSDVISLIYYQRLSKEFFDENGKEPFDDTNLVAQKVAIAWKHNTSLNLLGGNYSFYIEVPYWLQNHFQAKVGEAVVTDTRSNGLDDVIIEPLILNWKKGKYGIQTKVGFELGTGEHKNIPTSVGDGYTIGYLQADVSRMFAGKVLINAMCKYERGFNEKSDATVAGDRAYLGTTVLFNLFKGAVMVGPSFEWRWEVTDERGANPDDERDHRYQAGIVSRINVKDFGYVNLGVIEEYDVKDSPRFTKFLASLNRAF